ncbi:MAG: hypothetical protein H6840_06570 [Planctomycetes bacterium]|nr:hypothetical protein [Planctomycetota bacterium]
MSEAPKPRDEARQETLMRVIMIGVFGGVTLLYLLSAVFETPLEADNFTNSHSTSPGGHSALLALLRENGRQVRNNEVSLQPPQYEGRNTDTLVLLEPGPDYVRHFDTEFRNLFSSAMERETSVLVVLPKRHYRVLDAPQDGDLVLEEELHSLGEVQDILQRSGFDRWLNVTRVEAPAIRVEWWGEGGASELSVELEEVAQVFRAPRDLPDSFEVLAATVHGDPVAMRYRGEKYGSEGGVLLFSDPDIFTNRFIAQPGRAELVMRFFELTPRNGTLLVDEDLHGFSTDASLEYLAVTPPGLWLTLSVVVLLAIFGWRQATVLRPRSAEPQDRQARKFAIEGLARMMERAQDHHSAYKRVLKRSRLVLGAGGAQVQGAGMAGGTRAIRKGKTGRITRIQGGDDLERLINAARKVAHQKRTGEADHSDWDFG